MSVVAPTSEKAKEIMRYYIQHLGDNRMFFKQLDAKSRLDRLKQEESKLRIVLNNGGGIYTLSVDQRNYSKSIESAMGKGSRVTIVDEAGLIADNTESTIFRMIAGKGEQAFYCKIGNTFYTQPPFSHFYKTSKKYFKIWIDYKRALKEGRYSDEFINEAKGKPMFRELYECLFPPKDTIDPRGYRFMFDEVLLQNAYVDSLPKMLFNCKKPDWDERRLATEGARLLYSRVKGDRILGVDIGRGSDATAFIQRQGMYMWIDSTNQSRDTMAQVGEIGRLLKDGSRYANIDDIGVGGGVTDRALEAGLWVQGINWAKQPADTSRFANKKAENYQLFKEFLLAGGKILRDERWNELLEIKYKINSSEKIQMEPKEDLFNRGLKSPNVADAGALTFNVIIIPGITF